MSSRVFNSLTPSGPELELERYAGDDAHHEGDSEDLAPEPRRLVVQFVPVAHVEALEHEDEQREPHGGHREQKMVDHVMANCKRDTVNASSKPYPLDSPVATTPS